MVAVAKNKVIEILSNREHIVSLLLLGAFVALGARSAGQQREIEALEVEKSSLRSNNRAMSTALWDSRQNLFNVAESNPKDAPLPLHRLKSIFGEEQQQQQNGDSNVVATASIIPGLGVNVDDDSTPIA